MTACDVPLVPLYLIWSRSVINYDPITFITLLACKNVIKIMSHHTVKVCENSDYTVVITVMY